MTKSKKRNRTQTQHVVNKTETKSPVPNPVPAETKERRVINFNPDARKRNEKGQSLKDVVCAYWNAHRDADAKTIHAYVTKNGFPHANESTIRSWIGCFNRGYGFPRQFLASSGLREKMTQDQLNANISNGKLGDDRVSPILLKEKSLVINPACKTS